jgi:DNA-binding SARP family transcriptional activator/DNA-binding beta-propeller fold protein YncE
LTVDEKLSRAEFRILGPLQVMIRCEERPVAGEKLQVLLATLLLEANRPVSIERLIDELWGDRPPATARESIHAHVARLRRVLGPDGSECSLRREGRGYVLHVEGEQLDAARFRAALDAARDERRAGRLAAAREQYGEALSLWRGPVLDGVPLERADLERGELEGLREAALEERIDVDLELGRAGELVPELERLVQSCPLRERTWAQLMLALYETGRQADALATYQMARRTLAELGLQPGPTLRELEHSILTQDPSLVTRPGARAGVRLRPRFGRGAAAAVVAVVATVLVATAFVTRDQAPSAAPAPMRAVANSLIEIDPATNRVVSVTPVGRGPDSIAATVDAIWVANAEDRTVARVALRTKKVRIYGGAPVAHEVVSGLNGDVWLSSFEEPIVTLIAPRGHMARGERATAAGPRRIGLPGSAEGLAVGGGFLWVTSPSDSGGRDTVFRIDLRSRRLVSSVPVGKLPLFVSFGYGSAWVSNYEDGSVSVIRPGTEQAETIPVPGGPLGIAAGAGAVWVVTFWSRELVRIDPETRKVLHRIRVGRGPLGVAVGAGAIWVTNRDDRTLSRIDPGANKLSSIIRLAAAPYGVRFAHGRVWVTTQHCGSPVTPCDDRE